MPNLIRWFIKYLAKIKALQKVFSTRGSKLVVFDPKE